jgi:MFS family permease
MRAALACCRRRWRLARSRVHCWPQGAPSRGSSRCCWELQLSGGLHAGRAGTDCWLFAGSLVVIGVAALTVTNTSNSLMQLSTEPRMRGRVMALRLGVALSGTPIGAPIVGWVADNLGPRWALGVGAASGFAAALRAMSARISDDCRD